MTMTPTSESAERLFEQMKNGNQAAFAQLYDEYSPALYGLINRILSDADEADDILQDCFIKIWKKVHQYDKQKGTPFTWMLNISRNASIDRLRQRNNSRDRKIQIAQSNVYNTDNHKTQTSTDQIGLSEHISSLSPEHQLMIEYYYYKGYTHQEVADELDIPLGTVKTRLRKAIINLRKIFKLFLFWI